MKKQLQFTLFLTLLLLFTVYFVAPARAEPTLETVLSNLGFTDIEEVSDYDVTFPAGIYELTLYAEFAGYHTDNELSYYEIGTTTYNLIFAGPEGGFGYIEPPITKTVEICSEFGLSMLTPENHRYFTENSFNPDGQKHAKVYINKDNPSVYLIGFENLYGAGDRDYQDIVLSIKVKPPQNVVPEVPFGTIATMASMIIAMFGFIAFKRLQ